MKARDIARTAMFVALMAICSWISIPTVVPFTLQTFAVFLAVGVLGGKRGTLAVLVYLFIGALGVPVFSNFTGGVGALLGSTGGYLIGFLVSSLVTWALARAPGGGVVRLGIAMLAGLLVLYAFGTAWFMVVYTRDSGAVSFVTVLSWCVFPFVLPDVLKVALAAALSKRLQGAMRISPDGI